MTEYEVDAEHGIGLDEELRSRGEKGARKLAANIRE